MPTIYELVGFRFEAFRFSRSSYTFEFDGKHDGKYLQILVSTSYCLGRPDALENSSALVWQYLEQKLTKVEVMSEGDQGWVKFHFETGALRVWADIPQQDNLLIVTDRGSEDWYAVL